jgi:hypothetical protein
MATALNISSTAAQGGEYRDHMPLGVCGLDARGHAGAR